MLPKKLRNVQKGLSTYFGTRRGKAILVIVFLAVICFASSGLISQSAFDSSVVSIRDASGNIISAGDTIYEIDGLYLEASNVAPEEVGRCVLYLSVDDTLVSEGVRTMPASHDYKWTFDLSTVYKDEHMYYLATVEDSPWISYTFYIIGDINSPDIPNGNGNGNGDNGEVPIEPTVTHLDDVSYVVGTTGNTIVWTLQDDNPSWVEVFRDDERVLNAAWDVESLNITVEIDGLDVGSYTYRIVGTDMSGNEVEDVVTVTVSGGIGDISPVYLIVGAVVFIVLIGGRRD